MSHADPTRPSAASLELARAIRPALTRLYVTYFRIAEQSDLTGPQLSLLSRLQTQGPMRINQLATAEGIRMPTASNLLHNLEDRGLVERIRDPKDRRGVQVQLTAAGINELHRVGEERIDYLAHLLEALPESHAKDLPRVIEVINALGDAYDEGLAQGQKGDAAPDAR